MDAGHGRHVADDCAHHVAAAHRADADRGEPSRTRARPLRRIDRRHLRPPPLADLLAGMDAGQRCDSCGVDIHRRSVSLRSALLHVPAERRLGDEQPGMAGDCPGVGADGLHSRRRHAECGEQQHRARARPGARRSACRRFPARLHRCRMGFRAQLRVVRRGDLDSLEVASNTAVLERASRRAHAWIGAIRTALSALRSGSAGAAHPRLRVHLLRQRDLGAARACCEE